MKTKVNEIVSIEDLQNQKTGLEDRIKRLEADLRNPLEADFNEQAGQISNLIILRKLLEVERSNLRKVNDELGKKSSEA